MPVFGDYKYIVIGSSATITNYTGPGGNITIPSTLGGYSVTSISDSAFYNCTGLTGVIIPDSLIGIGDFAFAHCSDLTNVTIPEGVNSIGDSAFAYCSSLISAAISGSVTCVGDSVFAYCFNLISVTIPNTAISIGNSAFAHCSSLTSVSIPNSVISIGYSAFAYCNQLANVAIPNSVTSIGYSAFDHCANLTSVTLPNTINSIDLSTFYSCTSLISVTIPGTVSSIGDSAFADCTSLVATKFFGNAPTMGVRVFDHATPDFTVYYLYGKTGFTNPWHGYSTEPFYTADYDGNGNTDGSPPVDSNTYPQGATVTVLENTGSLIKAGYSFSGWNTQADGTGINYRPGQTFRIGTTNVVLYAMWTFYEYTVTGSNAAITKYVGPGGDVSIPATLAGYTVSSIDRIAFYASGVTSVTIPNTVSSIGGGAFYDCSGLTSITIPDSVKSIGDYAFAYCVNLAGVAIPKGVTSIGASVFEHCNRLASVTISSTVRSLGNGAFYDCSSLPSVTIPESVRSIDIFAFASCASLATAKFWGDAPTLGTGVFNQASPGFKVCYLYGKTGYTNPWHDYPAVPFYTITYAGNGNTGGNPPADSDTYLQGAAVTALENTGSLTKTGYSFSGWNTQADGTGTNYRPGQTFLMETANVMLYAIWTVYEYIVTGSGATITKYIGSGGDVVIPTTLAGYTVTGIAQYAFYTCAALTGVAIPSTVTSIAIFTFAYCTSLASVTIPNSITSIGDSAFAHCTSLVSVTIPNRVRSVGNYAFAYCSGLTSVTLPNSVTSIGNYAFYYCTGLSSVTLPNSVTSMGDSVFASCTSLANVTIPNRITTIGHSAFAYCASLRGVTLPNTINSIGPYAFYYCTSLSSATIPNRVARIGDSAFAYCSALTNVILPSTVTSLGDGSFYSCTNLAAAKFFGDAPTLGMIVFYGASTTFKIYYLHGKTGYTNPWNGYPTEPFYTMAYDGNTNTGGNPPVDSSTYLQGATVTVLENTGSLTKTGYAFSGWNTQADGAGTNYYAGQTFIMGTANVTLYAYWT